MNVEPHNSGPGPRGPNGLADEAAPGRTVLVVEDEPDLLEVTCFALESEGFVVETARHGREALERLRAGMRPSLVLLDLMMPVMSGLELLHEVAKIPTLQAIPIVVLTAGGAMEIPGAAGVLVKPIDLGLLIEAVQLHTGGGGGGAGA